MELIQIIKFGFNLDRKNICFSFPIAKKLCNTNIVSKTDTDVNDFVVLCNFEEF